MSGDPGRGGELSTQVCTEKYNSTKNQAHYLINCKNTWQENWSLRICRTAKQPLQQKLQLGNLGCWYCFIRRLKRREFALWNPKDHAVENIALQFHRELDIQPSRYAFPANCKRHAIWPVVLLRTVRIGQLPLVHIRNFDFILVLNEKILIEY